MPRMLIAALILFFVTTSFGAEKKNNIHPEIWYAQSVMVVSSFADASNLTPKDGVLVSEVESASGIGADTTLCTKWMMRT